MEYNEKLYGFYRAEVVGNKDPEKKGRIIVWIPQIMPELTEDNQGIMALPANNPIGGRNEQGDKEHHYMGSCLIPKKGSWVFCFFEGGDVNYPFYFGSLELENNEVLPECQLGENHEDKWVLFKSHEGRCVVISDDPEDARVEITGKKRKIKDGPTGDKDSVYMIDENQTTILLDERQGKEKLLIRTHKGDFLNINIENRTLEASFDEAIIFKSKNIYFEAIEEINSKAATYNAESTGSLNMKSASDMNLESGANHSIKAGGTAARDGSSIADQSGAAASSASAKTTPPSGDRD